MGGIGVKRLLSCLLCLCLALPLFGGALAEEGNERQYGTTEDGPLGYFPEPVTVRVVKGIQSTEADRFSLLESITGETLYDNRWTDLYERELNIKIEYLWVVDESQYQQKLQLAMASGEMPDVVSLPLDQISSVSEAEQIWADLTPFFEEYASDMLKGSIEAVGYGAIESVTLDGEMKAIPYARNNMDDYKFMFIREDWLRNVGMEAPTNLEELLAVCDAFVNQDPDGNGEKDTYAMAAENSLWYHFNPMFWMYGAYPAVDNRVGVWLEMEDGTLANGRIQPEVKEALRTLQTMHNNGYFDPEFPLKTEFQQKPMINANRIGIDFAGNWEVENLGPVIASVPGCEWKAYPIPELIPGEPTIGVVGSGVTRGYVINKDMEHPEAIIKMMNLGLIVSQEHPEIYVDAEVPVIWPLAAVHAPNPGNGYRRIDLIRQVQSGAITADDLPADIRTIYDQLETNDKFKSQFGNGDNSSVYLSKMARENGLVLSSLFFGNPTPTMAERYSTLEELTRTAFLKIITDNADVDETFANFVADWKSLGGDQMTQEVNERYNAPNP